MIYSNGVLANLKSAVVLGRKSKRFLASACLLFAVPFGGAAATTVIVDTRAGGCFNSSDASSSSLVATCSDSAANPGIWSVVGSAFARAEVGSVGVGAGAIASQQSRGGQNDFTSYARAEVIDYLTFSVASGFLRIPIDLAGWIETRLGSSDENLNTGDAQARVRVSYGQYDNGNIFYADLRQVGNDSRIFTGGNVGITDVYFPIEGNQTSVRFIMSAYAYCLSSNVAYQTCNSIVNFESSARFLGASVLDLNGNVLTGVDISSSSGFDYYKGVSPHVSAVPLSPSGLFLIFALLGLPAASFARRVPCK